MERRSVPLRLGGALALPLVVLIVGCGAATTPSAAAAGVASLPPPVPPAELFAAFGSPRAASIDGEPVALEARVAGDLNLPSGRVVAADPFFIGTGPEPFAGALPPDVHPVLLLVARFAEGENVAAAIVGSPDATPVTWQPARVEGEPEAGLAPDEVHGYAVDSGNGSFASAEVALLLEDLDAGQRYSDRLLEALEKAPPALPSVDVVVDEGKGLDVVAFPSGYGDGAFGTWLGLDADGRPVAVMTDFGVLDAGALASSPAPSGSPAG